MRSSGESRVESNDTRITPDARKLLWILAIFNWVALLLYSRNAPLDFVAFYTAGRFVLAGDSANLFDLTRQASFQTSVFGKPGTLPFYHLAYESLIFVPFSLFSFQVSLWLWRAVLAGLITGICSLVRRVFDLCAADACIIVLSFMSTALAFAQGQDSLLLMWLCATAFVLLLKGKDGAAGVSLSVAIFKPHLVLPIASVIAWKRGGKFVAGFAAGTMCLLGISTVITGRQGWVQWFRAVGKAASGTGREIGASARFMANSRGFMSLLIHDARVVLVISVLLALVLFAFTLWRLRDCKDPKIYVPVAVAMAVMVSYHLNIHDLVVLLFPVCALIASRDRTVPVQLCLGFFYAVPAFLIFDMVPLFFVVTVGLWVYTMPQGASNPQPQ